MNIYDLAKAAGVSIATASKALNGRHDVNAETRQRVQDFALKLNYHPSRLARGLAKNRTENIGLIALRRFGFPLLTNPFYSRVLEGMEGEVAASDYNLLLSIGNADDGKVPVPKKIREKNVDGLILLGWMPDTFLDEIKGRDLPFVLVDHEAPGLKAWSLGLDNAGGAAMAVDRLVKAGFKEISIVSGPSGDVSFRERRDGALDAMRKLGIKLGELLEPKLLHDLNADDLKAFVGRLKKPSAALCVNDDHALKLMSAARELGLSLPKDLSVTGFDDIEFSDFSQPGLSTLRVDKQALGARAVRLLVDMLDKGAPRQGRERMPVEWIERQSIA